VAKLMVSCGSAVSQTQMIRSLTTPGKTINISSKLSSVHSKKPLNMDCITPHAAAAATAVIYTEQTDRQTEGCVDLMARIMR